ncbi:hypothetical protein K2173_003324 [Erythroxylum novogranatense]|uniref:Peptidase M28 domain-containing protein n=1 Tax=Erythroxylum novogranatense TaxID=1862640 RepID=A0AAV8SXA0_9ROSI|nr:hypothetical protein K2173_003324 [Erythroxylum novogranatense]
MVYRISARDATGFKFMFFLTIMYGLLAALTYFVIHIKFVKPLGIDAPVDRFSEARAVEHVHVLTEDGRQEGRPGLKKAALYIKSQLESIKERAGPDIRIEIEENYVNGSFNMMFLGHSISLGYRNHVNIVMRISSADSREIDPSVLINAHFDSPPGSPGAGDCGSCVASLLEVARVMVDSKWIPPKPVIFLFNGAEELFMLGTHGFMTTHRWRDSIGASINVEASGTGGPDLVCQSGPGIWPSLIYAQSAIYPMASSAAQDVFPLIPGDTDFRIFSQDFEHIPSLDIIFLLGGYYYHTSFDTVDKLLPGSMQARGENLFNVLKAFAKSSELRNAQDRKTLEASANNMPDDQAVFFDYLGQFMVFYPTSVAVILHSSPIVIFLLMPFLLRFLHYGLRSSIVTFYDFVKGMLLHTAGVILSIIIPVAFSIVRLLFSNHAMNWFAHPHLAFVMFIPGSLIGLLTPTVLYNHFPLTQNISVIKKSKEALSDEARFWGAFGFYACITLVFVVAGLSGGFLTFYVSAFMLLAWTFFCLTVKLYDRQSLWSTFFYVIPLVPCLAYTTDFGGFLVQFLIEKMGMMGAVPPPYGYFIADAVIAATVGAVTGWCVGPLIPIGGRWMARSSILKFLLHVTVLAMALSSQFFPYSTLAPKRVIFQHTFVTAGANEIVESSYDFSVVDSNSLLFLFKHAPEVAKELHISSEFSFETANVSLRQDWMGTFPLSHLFSRSLKFPANNDDTLKRYRVVPQLVNYKSQTLSDDGRSRRVHLELTLGDLEEVWVAVLNITGPLSSWSFADNKLTDPERIDGGPPSYICRLSGNSHEKWTFWLEATGSGDLRVDVAVIDQNLAVDAKRLKGLFPDWVDANTYSSYLSNYRF